MRGKQVSIRHYALLSATTLLLALVLTPALAAQGTNLRFTLFGAGSFLKADRTFPANGQTYHTEFASGGRAGVRVTLDVTDHLSAEGSYAYGTNNFRLSHLNSVPPLVRGFGVRAQQFSGDILYFLSGPASRMRPFAAFGVGILRLSPTGAAKEAAVNEGFIAGPATLSSGNKFDFNYGFGVEERLHRYFGIRFSIRDYVIEVPRLGAPPGPGAIGAGFFPVSGLSHDLELSAGLVLYTSPR